MLFCFESSIPNTGEVGFLKQIDHRMIKTHIETGFLTTAYKHNIIISTVI